MTIPVGDRAARLRRSNQPTRPAPPSSSAPQSSAAGAEAASSSAAADQQAAARAAAAASASRRSAPRRSSPTAPAAQGTREGPSLWLHVVGDATFVEHVPAGQRPSMGSMISLFTQRSASSQQQQQTESATPEQFSAQTELVTASSRSSNALAQDPPTGGSSIRRAPSRKKEKRNKRAERAAAQQASDEELARQQQQQRQQQQEQQQLQQQRQWASFVPHVVMPHWLAELVTSGRHAAANEAHMRAPLAELEKAALAAHDREHGATGSRAVPQRVMYENLRYAQSLRELQELHGTVTREADAVTSQPVATDEAKPAGQNSKTQRKKAQKERAEARRQQDEQRAASQKPEPQAARASSPAASRGTQPDDAASQSTRSSVRAPSPRLRVSRENTPRSSLDTTATTSAEARPNKKLLKAERKNKRSTESTTTPTPVVAPAHAASTDDATATAAVERSARAEKLAPTAKPASTKKQPAVEKPPPVEQPALIKKPPLVVQAPPTEPARSITRSSAIERGTPAEEPVRVEKPAQSGKTVPKSEKTDAGAAKQSVPVAPPGKTALEAPQKPVTVATPQARTSYTAAAKPVKRDEAVQAQAGAQASVSTAKPAASTTLANNVSARPPVSFQEVVPASSAPPPGPPPLRPPGLAPGPPPGLAQGRPPGLPLRLPTGPPPAQPFAIPPAQPVAMPPAQPVAMPPAQPVAVSSKAPKSTQRRRGRVNQKRVAQEAAEAEARARIIAEAVRVSEQNGPAVAAAARKAAEASESAKRRARIPSKHDAQTVPQEQQMPSKSAPVAKPGHADASLRGHARHASRTDTEMSFHTANIAGPSSPAGSPDVSTATAGLDWVMARMHQTPETPPRASAVDARGCDPALSSETLSEHLPSTPHRAQPPAVDTTPHAHIDRSLVGPQQVSQAGDTPSTSWDSPADQRSDWTRLMTPALSVDTLTSAQTTTSLDEPRTSSIASERRKDRQPSWQPSIALNEEEEVQDLGLGAVARNLGLGLLSSPSLPLSTSSALRTPHPRPALAGARQSDTHPRELQSQTSQSSGSGEPRLFDLPSERAQRLMRTAIWAQSGPYAPPHTLLGEEQLSFLAQRRTSGAAQQYLHTASSISALELDSAASSSRDETYFVLSSRSEEFLDDETPLPPSSERRTPRVRPHQRLSFQQRLFFALQSITRHACFKLVPELVASRAWARDQPSLLEPLQAQPTLRRRRQIFAALVQTMPTFEDIHVRRAASREQRLRELCWVGIEEYVGRELRSESPQRGSSGKQGARLVWLMHSVQPPGARLSFSPVARRHLSPKRAHEPVTPVRRQPYTTEPNTRRTSASRPEVLVEGDVGDETIRPIKTGLSIKIPEASAVVPSTAAKSAAIESLSTVWPSSPGYPELREVNMSPTTDGSSEGNTSLTPAPPSDSRWLHPPPSAHSGQLHYDVRSPWLFQHPQYFAPSSYNGGWRHDLLSSPVLMPVPVPNASKRDSDRCWLRELESVGTLECDAIDDFFAASDAVWRELVGDLAGEPEYTTEEQFERHRAQEANALTVDEMMELEQSILMSPTNARTHGHDSQWSAGDSAHAAQGSHYGPSHRQRRHQHQQEPQPQPQQRFKPMPPRGETPARTALYVRSGTSAVSRATSLGHRSASSQASRVGGSNRAASGAQQQQPRAANGHTSPQHKRSFRTGSESPTFVRRHAVPFAPPANGLIELERETIRQARQMRSAQSEVSSSESALLAMSMRQAGLVPANGAASHDVSWSPTAGHGHFDDERAAALRAAHARLSRSNDWNGMPPDELQARIGAQQYMVQELTRERNRLLAQNQASLAWQEQQAQEHLSGRASAAASQPDTGVSLPDLTQLGNALMLELSRRNVSGDSQYSAPLSPEQHRQQQDEIWRLENQRRVHELMRNGERNEWQAGPAPDLRRGFPHEQAINAAPARTMPGEHRPQPRDARPQGGPARRPRQHFASASPRQPPAASLPRPVVDLSAPSEVSYSAGPAEQQTPERLRHSGAAIDPRSSPTTRHAPRISYGAPAVRVPASTRRQEQMLSRLASAEPPPTTWPALATTSPPREETRHEGSPARDRAKAAVGHAEDPTHVDNVWSQRSAALDRTREQLVHAATAASEQDSQRKSEGSRRGRGARQMPKQR